MRIELGTPMTLHEIAHATESTLQNNADIIITHISLDSRLVESGDLFLAIKGKNGSGEDYSEHAKNRGGLVMSSKADADILCANTSVALLNLAHYYVSKLPNILYRIGITGSVGKTTVKEFTNILLSTQYKTYCSKGNYNNEIGMPLSILSATIDTEILLMEMGMNHSGEISRLSKCLGPNIAAITNIGTAHIGNLGSREAIAKAKLEITDGMNEGALIIPYEENLLTKVSNHISFSADQSAANIYIKGEDENVQVLINGTSLCKCKFSLMEIHHKKCLATAVAISVCCNMSALNIQRGISAISSENTRQSVISACGLDFYQDYYNASFESVCACIETAKMIRINKHKHLLLGDILELGDMSDSIHYNIGRMISPSVFQNLFLVGEAVKNVKAGAISIGFSAERIFLNDNLSAPEYTTSQIKKYCNMGDMIFMKASRAIRLERIIDCFDCKTER